jgi:hypothetical protein
MKRLNISHVWIGSLAGKINTNTGKLLAATVVKQVSTPSLSLTRPRGYI